MSVFLRNQYNLHLLSNAKQSFLKMNGNKLVVVILNNHCRICQFFNLEGKSHKYFQVRKQLCFFGRAWIFWHFPGNNLTRSRIIFWVPGCCYSNIDVTVGVTASLLLFSSLHKFYWDTAFIPRTLRRYSLPRSWVKFAVAKFTVISITTVATTVLLACMIRRWITDGRGNNQREVWNGHVISLIYHARAKIIRNPVEGNKELAITAIGKLCF